MLDKIAAVSAGIQTTRVARTQHLDSSPVQQFTLAAVARTALAESMVFRADEPVSDQALARLCHMSIQVDQPDVPDEGVLPSSIMRKILGRLAYQQQMFFHGELEDLMRTLALFDDDLEVPEMPTFAQWEHLLGVPLPTYLAIAFTAFVGANVHAGHLPHAAIAAAARVGAFGPGVDADTAIRVLDTHFASDPAELQATAKASKDEDFAAGREIWLSNPLLGTPLVRRPDGFLAPITPYMLHKITPMGMYFTGSAPFGHGFSRAVGRSFERLVGLHLSLLEQTGALVYPEREYGRDKRLTCDWLVVLPNMVLLVEAKGMRSTEQVRVGDDEGIAALAGRLQRARKQIATTAKLITDRIPELADIPGDRPIRGLVVTLEPIHLVNTSLYEELLEPTTVETAITSAHALEEVLPILAQAPDGHARLLDALTSNPPTPAAFERAAAGLDRVRNPVSLELWEKWRSLIPLEG
ncbi:hypothetical protein ACWDUL_20550 [Nocardia niigatensis]